jgi:hypothetical protein
LIQPNPDSALNAEAGALLQESYDVFARRAELMTSINATIPQALRTAAAEAQSKGQEPLVADGPVRKRRTIAQSRAKAALMQAANAAAPPQRIVNSTAAPSLRPFVLQAGNDDIFGQHQVTPPNRTRDAEEHQTKTATDDENMTDADQENDQLRSPQKLKTPLLSLTPRRPHGAAIPLGELVMEETDGEDRKADNDGPPSNDANVNHHTTITANFTSDEEMTSEPEYPPSPRKNSSPSKSPAKKRLALNAPHQHLTLPTASTHAEGSRDARNITPLNLIDRPLAEDSPFAASLLTSPSPRKQALVRANLDLFDTPGTSAHLVSRSLFGRITTAGGERGGAAGLPAFASKSHLPKKKSKISRDAFSTASESGGDDDDDDDDEMHDNDEDETGYHGESSLVFDSLRNDRHQHHHHHHHHHPQPQRSPRRKQKSSSPSSPSSASSSPIIPLQSTFPLASTAPASKTPSHTIATPLIALRPPHHKPPHRPRQQPNRITKNTTSPSTATAASAAVASSPPSRRRRQHVQDMQRLWDACGGDVTRWNRGDFDLCVEEEEKDGRADEGVGTSASTVTSASAAAGLSLLVGRGKAGRW